MQPHSLFVLASVWACGCAELTLKQPQLSITKAETKTAHIECIVQDCWYVHWYQQKEGEGPNRILYVQTGSQSSTPVYDQGFSKIKFDFSKKDNSYALIVYSTIRSDEATYYCACWGSGVKYFGTGTQLMITSRPTKKPSAKILPPSPAEVENNGEGTFLCILNGFFPYIIKVEWAEKGETSSSQLKMETGEIASNDFLVSWLTVSKADLWNKQFECQYWHESNSQSKGYKEKEITNPGIGKAGGPAEGERCPSDIVNSTNIAKSMVLNFSNNVAYITYILLLLKSTCYSSIIVFFIYKMKTASTSHDKA